MRSPAVPVGLETRGVAGFLYKCVVTIRNRRSFLEAFVESDSFSWRIPRSGRVPWKVQPS